MDNLKDEIVKLNKGSMLIEAIRGGIEMVSEELNGELDYATILGALYIVSSDIEHERIADMECDGLCDECREKREAEGDVANDTIKDS